MSTVNLLGERTLNGLFYAPPSDLIDDDEVQDYLVFMITGNPGLISYYEPFLSTLHNILTSSFDSSSSRFYVCGHSLAGFDTSKSDDAENLVLPAGLFQQISNTEKLLYQQIDRLQKATSMKERPLKVILMGHSVGAYILLELISNHRLRVEEGQKDFDLIGGILLFPTITHLAQSPQGMIYSKVLQIPHFAHIAGDFVKYLFALVPIMVLVSIIKLFMQYPEHAAKTTASFLKSSIGVRQALYLARDEMHMIHVDKWEEGVWEAATNPGTNHRDTANSNLFLYWGKDDKLVANKTRDELIAAREYRSAKGMGNSSKSWKPSMLIDQDGIPHAFCIKHSETVAEKVKDWIEQIVEENGGGEGQGLD